MDRTIPTERYYDSLERMRRRFDRCGRRDLFSGKTREEFESWRQEIRALLKKLTGIEVMETCPLNPVILDKVETDEGIIREKVLLQVEPDVYMTLYILIPESLHGERRECFLALPGHMGAGKYSVAGCREIASVRDSIDRFHYDYGMALARMGYVVCCPDCRGFGERREEAMQNDSEEAFMNGSCFWLSHMAGGLGETVIGMYTWDNMRLIDYIYERDEWDTDNLSCVGFSGGGMQTLWLAALDDRVQRAVISGYLYGYKDSLLTLNGNCSCNYVPHLWEHLDMGDIASLIAPRALVVQSCREDDLNGTRGLANVLEQMEIIRRAYSLYGKEEMLAHDIREGGHCFHQEVLERFAKQDRKLS